MDTSQDFKEWQDKLQTLLVATTRTANNIASHDLDFYRAVDPAVADKLAEQTARLLDLSTRLLKAAADANGLKAAPVLNDVDDIELNWRGVVDVVDSLLEKADTALDEYTGLVKRTGVPAPVAAPMAKKPRQSDRLERSLQRANILKPQGAFEHPPNNLDTAPWKPILTSKPHAIVPLEESLGTAPDDPPSTEYDYLSCLPLLGLARQPPDGDDDRCQADSSSEKKRQKIRAFGSNLCADGRLRFKHPYETEILSMRYPDAVYEKRDPIPYLPAESTTATWVDTFEGVLAMLDELKEADEIAIDLEHHDFRSYAGILSLMQISTREKDWIIDTLKPWRHRLEVLNEVFADPTKVKVFHGAFMDIIWLQRDLGLYVVGLFDTFHACEIIEFPKKSLAFLLKRYADFDADKKYQTADWRIRPLPDEMFYYARSDTHYLLYVYDMLRNHLIDRSTRSDPEKDLIELAIQKSKETSLSRYEGLPCDPETGQGSRGWFNALAKSPFMLNAEQFSVYKAVHNWRDRKARLEDESPGFVMHNQSLVEIAKIMPSNLRVLLSLFHGVSHIVKSSMSELLRLIEDAKAEVPAGLPPPSSSVRKLSRANFSRGRGSAPAKFERRVLPNATDLRSHQSQFWGALPVSTLWEARPKAGGKVPGERVAIPTGSIFAPVALGHAPVPVKLDVIPPPQTSDAKLQRKPTRDPSGQEFTLWKGRAPGSVEAPAATHSSSATSDSSDSDDEGGSKPLNGMSVEISPDGTRKTVARETHKRRRGGQPDRPLAKREQEQGAGSGQEADEAPFDYSTAQSVLHAQRTHGTGAGGKKVFNPYLSKTTAEGPKGARRMHSERPGKTATFKR